MPLGKITSLNNAHIQQQLIIAVFFIYLPYGFPWNQPNRIPNQYMAKTFKFESIFDPSFCKLKSFSAINIPTPPMMDIKPQNRQFIFLESIPITPSYLLFRNSFHRIWSFLCGVCIHCNLHHIYCRHHLICECKVHTCLRFHK